MDEPVGHRRMSRHRFLASVALGGAGLVGGSLLASRQTGDGDRTGGQPDGPTASSEPLAAVDDAPETIEVSSTRVLSGEVANKTFIAAPGIEGAVVVVRGGSRLANVSVDAGDHPVSCFDVEGGAVLVGCRASNGAVGFRRIRVGSEPARFRGCAASGMQRGASIGFQNLGQACEIADCHAERCATAGFYIDGRCRWEGTTTSSGNTIGFHYRGTEHVLPRGATLRANGDVRFGHYLKGVRDAHFDGTLEAHDIGRAQGNDSGTGVELWEDCTGNVFRRIVATGSPGYGVAIANASSGNVMDELDLDRAGATEGDPGLSIVNASRNRIGRVRVRGHTVAVRFGEDDFRRDAPVEDNIVEFVEAYDVHYGALKFEDAIGCRIERARLVNCRGDGTYSRACIDFGYEPEHIARDCVVGHVEIEGDEHIPLVVSFSEFAENCRILGGTVAAPFGTKIANEGIDCRAEL